MEQKTPKIVLLITILFLLLMIISLYNPWATTLDIPSSIRSPPSSPDMIRNPSVTEPFEATTMSSSGCDLFIGEWVPNNDVPYYSNDTCWAIHEHQNCMKYGRPDTEFLRWRWKPDACELPVFNPAQFLELMRDKSMAFVGDSVARNQMQSLICLLSRVEYPIDMSQTSNENFKQWEYTSYNFTLLSFWTTHLVRSTETRPPGTPHPEISTLTLDEPDPSWATEIDTFDYLIISTGRWFMHPMVFYEERKLVGCHYCLMDNVEDLTKFYGYRKAMRTSFRTINAAKNFKGITYLRTLSPSHFENGIWNKGGNCVRTRPFHSSETTLGGDEMEMYMIQVEEFRRAEEEGRRRGKRYRLLDTTQAMALRPDGHPSRYGHWPEENVALYNDCVHWCLPGPIDAWNDLLLEMMKNEGRRSKAERIRWSSFRKTRG